VVSLPAVPTLSRGAVDRSSERRDDPEWLAESWRSGKVLVIDADGKTSVDDDGPALHLLGSGNWSESEPRLLLGVGPDGTSYWATVGEPPKALGARVLGLREVGAALSDLDAGLLVTAVALANWHATHVRCPRCGESTEVMQAGWSRRCIADGSQHFPRTDPAVIVLIHDGGERALLGRQPAWPRGRYSTIAGFVEAGESAEQAVAREVLEETGVIVGDVIYRASQPWPFPASLMLGYEARAIGGRVQTADDELEDVRWFTRDELRGDVATLPPSASIAHWLITGWLTRP
jgi:NAD+ diphosphatase